AVAAPRLAPLRESAEHLRELSEEALGCALSPPVTDTVDGVATLAMHAVSRFRVTSASASVPHVGSGDRIRFFEVAEDCHYAVLSDGMGSGERAAATAEVSVEFLETMLTAGTGRAASLRMLNDLVRTQSTECSATVDLFVFDMMYGHAAFFKSGAAPSYIKRGSEVLRVRSHTMPLGLSRTPDTERINVEVAARDVVILLSDGLVPDGEEPAWLLSLLSSEPADDLDALATRIVAEAVSRLPEPRDDITVGLVRIEEE
ncbi:MAG: SpoIIE family protein phosphatase, partial [Clostridia bacterium]|nr:SpoIIE family protein phosphatase [Clostridia bacterium]